MNLRKQIKRLRVYQNCRRLVFKDYNVVNSNRGKLLLAARRKLVFDLKVKGRSYRQIAKMLGITQTQAFNDVKNIIKKMEERTKDLAARDRQIELVRLDKMYLSLEPKIRKGDEYAIDRGLKIMQQRAKYIPGYEEPNKLQLMGDKENPIEIEFKYAQQECLNILKKLIRITKLWKNLRYLMKYYKN
jgi:DNA-binding CsgD family transcriptional regulator